MDLFVQFPVYLSFGGELRLRYLRVGLGLAAAAFPVAALAGQARTLDSSGETPSNLQPGVGESLRTDETSLTCPTSMCFLPCNTAQLYLLPNHLAK